MAQTGSIDEKSEVKNDTVPLKGQCHEKSFQTETVGA